MAKRRKRRKKTVRGFEANARRIARKQGVSMKRARAMLASGTRRASPAAKRRNPRLKRVKGKAKPRKRRTTKRRRRKR